MWIICSNQKCLISCAHLQAYHLKLVQLQKAFSDAKWLHFLNTQELINAENDSEN